MRSITKVHDGIIGSVNLLFAALAIAVDARWAYGVGVISLVMISSSFTGFCPLYYTLGKLMPASAR